MNPVNMNQAVRPQHMGGYQQLPPDKYGGMPPSNQAINPNRNPSQVNGSSTYPNQQNINNQPPNQRPTNQPPLANQMQNMYISDPNRGLNAGGPQKPPMPITSQYQNGAGKPPMGPPGQLPPTSGYMPPSGGNFPPNSNVGQPRMPLNNMMPPSSQHQPLPAQRAPNAPMPNQRMPNNMPPNSSISGPPRPGSTGPNFPPTNMMNGPPTSNVPQGVPPGSVAPVSLHSIPQQNALQGPSSVMPPASMSASRGPMPPSSMTGLPGGPGGMNLPNNIRGLPGPHTNSSMNGYVPPAGPPQNSAAGYGPPRPGMGPLPGAMGDPMMQQQSNLQNAAPMGPPNSMQNPPGGYPMTDNMPPPGMQPSYPQPGSLPPGQNQVRQPGYGSMPAQPPQPARRLDPDQMPSPIQVMEYDSKTRTGNFYTNQKGQLPPLVSTKFTVHDQGNCSPRFIRSTIYNVPSSPDMLKQTAVPFAISISPFANVEEGEHPPPLVNLGEMGPVRCNRCKAYMCPFMQFIDGGRRFQCTFCKCTTEVPAEYFCHLDHTGQRSDKYQRPELCLGSYELTATLDYCKNSKYPDPPAFIFMLDVSYNSVRSGVVNLLCQNMKNLLKSLPTDNEAESKVRVGFVTYSNVIHFYNVKACLSQPQMMVVPDVKGMFMPLLDGFLVNASEAEAVIDSLMEQIPTMFGDTRETETILGPVIQAGLEALKAADCSGKLFVFHSSLPIADAPGKLRNRDDRKVLGTDKEKSVLSPQDQFYNNLGQECVAAGCSVDLFTFPNSYVDLATVGQVCRLTGGQIFKYSYFQSDIDGVRFLEDLKRDLERPIAFDAIMRVRTSTGVRPTDFFGNYFMSNTTDVELASMDCDKAITAEIKHDDKLTEEDGVYIQVATLFTSVNGQRRLRVHNLSLNCCTQMADLFRNCELDTIMNFFAKQSMRVILDQNPKAVKDNYIQRSANILACYRKNCASPSSVGQLILPEGMKLLPLYTNCLIKSDALAGGSDLTTDDRSFFMQFLTYADVDSSLGYLYPRIFSLHDMDPSENFPKTIRTSSEKLQDDGIYLLENGIYIFFWVGLTADPTLIQDIFGVPSPAQINVDQMSALPELDNETSLKIRDFIDVVRSERHRSMKFTVVRQRDKLDLLFRNFLVEDKSVNGGASYVDFLCHLHKEIRSLLS